MLNRTDRDMKKGSKLGAGGTQAKKKKAEVTELERFRDRHIENQYLLPNNPTGLQQCLVSMFEEHVTGQKTKKGPLSVVINTINGFKENYENYGVRAGHKAYKEMLEQSNSKEQQ